MSDLPHNDPPITPSTARPRRNPSPATGHAETDAAITRLVEICEVNKDSDLLTEMLGNVVRLCADGSDRGELKLINSAIRDLRRASAQFAPYIGQRKCSIFGSARTPADDPGYVAAHEMGAALVEAGWMVITGGGPGIMTAGIEGAGRENSFGVTIRLPFEPMDGGGIVPDERLVRFRNFFSRKLTFMRQSQAYVVFPGGYGTLDEAFELLTLIQTGKATPAPIVLFEPPGDAYWKRWRDFIDYELLDAKLISPNDVDLVHITSSVDDAIAYIDSFYEVYHSMRWVGDQLVIRLTRPISDEKLAELNSEFADVLVSGSIARTTALAAEVDDDDALQLPRILLMFNQRSFGRLHQLVRSLA